MVDLFVINPPTFYNKKLSAKDHPNPKLDSKIQAIITTFACFKEESIHNTTPTAWTQATTPKHHPRHHNGGFTHHKHHHRAHQNKHHNRHIDISKKPVISNGTQTELTREINGLLNKLSVQNYKNIVERLRAVCKHDPNMITHTLLSKCCSQETYADLYMNVLLAMHAGFPSEVLNAVNVYWGVFQSTFITQLRHVADIEHSGDSYDTMCSFFKHKKHLIAQFKSILSLRRHRLIHVTDEDLIAYLINILRSVKDDMACVNVVTICIHDFVNIIGYVSPDQVSELEMLYKSNIEPHCGRNTEFKWMGIMDVLRKKLK